MFCKLLTSIMMEASSDPSRDDNDNSGLDPVIVRRVTSVNHDNMPSQHPAGDENSLTMSTRRVAKNLGVVSFSFFAFLTGFQSLSNLQSTMNAEKGLGVDAQALMYACAMASALLLPELLIKKLGCKRTLILAILASCPYIAANFYPRWETLLPTAAMMGLASGPFNTAGMIYVNEMATRYHASVSDSLETVMARFYCVFSFCQEHTQIWGNLISYFVLTQGMAIIHPNGSEPQCGVDFRLNASGNMTNPNLQPPTNEERYLLVTIYVLFIVTAAIVTAMFMDTLGNDIDREKADCGGVLHRVFSAVRHLQKPNQILILPFTILCGMQIAFYTVDFTQAYIACSFGGFR